jgi:hypothetical protein
MEPTAATINKNLLIENKITGVNKKKKNRTKKEKTLSLTKVAKKKVTGVKTPS